MLTRAVRRETCQETKIEEVTREGVWEVTRGGVREMTGEGVGDVG